jgi:hypothetical protein
MREIKFRYVYKRDDGDDIAAYEYTLNEIADGKPLSTISVLNGLGGGYYRIIASVQYTGLKDIYEGDWLEFSVFDHNGSDTQYKGCVVYQGSRFVIFNKPDDEYYGSDGAFDLDWVVEQDDEIKIIGNIHQHPELLEQQ